MTAWIDLTSRPPSSTDDELCMGGDPSPSFMASAQLANCGCQEQSRGRGEEGAKNVSLREEAGADKNEGGEWEGDPSPPSQ